MSSQTIRTALMVGSLLLGSSAVSLVLAASPQANQGQTIQTARKGIKYQDDNYKRAGEPGTVYRSVVVTRDGTVKTETIVHPRYDDSAFRK